MVLAIRASATICKMTQDGQREWSATRLIIVP
uniref:Uncharacterized protein n=1 Tax=Heterorhabditis bacteriophora TaxID=37862 RepID=A0A1I7X521_HETBA